jgi:hypothetical protein
MRLEDMGFDGLVVDEESEVTVDSRSMRTSPVPLVCSIDDCGQEN